MNTVRLTTGQALVRYLIAQDVERDGDRNPFFAGCWGIFGHGNVGGLAQALQEAPEFPYYLARNEQAMAHSAAAFARMRDRLQTMACATSIGPGATNMVTAAAGATINRLPVLLLPGDTFARRNVAPVLQQLESAQTQDVSVNDAFRPVSRYWDRIQRPEQLLYALPEAMRVLTSPVETGAVTLCLPQDVQAEAHEFPAEMFERRVWTIGRPLPDPELLQRALELIRSAKRPLIVAGGGVIYSGATDALSELASRTGIPVAETIAGKGCLVDEHPQNVGGLGVTGVPPANILAREADLVIGIGTRYTDLTTASQTAFQDPEVRFININLAEFDAFKQGALPLVGDARATIEQLLGGLAGPSVASATRSERVADLRADWFTQRRRLIEPNHSPLPAQSEIIGAINDQAQPLDVLVGAAGSMPAEMHKLWRSSDPKSFHLEYGYSTMGYELSGGIGCKMADRDRGVVVLVGDGSFQLMPGELATAVQEGLELTVVLVDNKGYGSIRGLSEKVGSHGWGTRFRMRDAESGQLDGAFVEVDLVGFARSLGAAAVRADTIDELREALRAARGSGLVTVIVIEADPFEVVPTLESWWDVPISEVSKSEDIAAAREQYERAVVNERHLFGPGATS